MRNRTNNKPNFQLIRPDTRVRDLFCSSPTVLLNSNPGSCICLNHYTHLLRTFALVGSTIFVPGLTFSFLNRNH
jgi:hypothetical protein